MGRGIHRVRDADVRLYLQIVDERDAALRAWESFLRQWDAFIAPVSCVPSIDACPPGTPIDVTVVYPGYIRTEMTADPPR